MDSNPGHIVLHSASSHQNGYDQVKHHVPELAMD